LSFRRLETGGNFILPGWPISHFMKPAYEMLETRVYACPAAPRQHR
jgi:hypothetical protein